MMIYGHIYCSLEPMQKFQSPVGPYLRAGSEPEAPAHLQDDRRPACMESSRSQEETLRFMRLTTAGDAIQRF